MTLDDLTEVMYHSAIEVWDGRREKYVNLFDIPECEYERIADRKIAYIDPGFKEDIGNIVWVVLED